MLGLTPDILFSYSFCLPLFLTLCGRLHEIKRISKSLSSYFEGLSKAHLEQAATILKLSATSILQTPFPESSLFIPLKQGGLSPTNTPTKHTGQPGWAELILQIRDDTKLEAEGHAELSKLLAKSVVVPLKKMVSSLSL